MIPPPFTASSVSKMANRTVGDAKSVRGTNPQYLVEKIIRTRIYESKYWKEECFALTGKVTLQDIHSFIFSLLLVLHTAQMQMRFN